MGEENQSRVQLGDPRKGTHVKPAWVLLHPPAGKPYSMPWQVDTTGGERNGIIWNNNYLTNTTNLSNVTTKYGIIRFNDQHENNEISFDFLFIGAAPDQEITVSMRNISFEDFAFVTFTPGGIRLVDKHPSATVANGFAVEGFYLDEFTPVTHWNATWYETYIRAFGSTLSVWVRPRTASPTLTSWVASTAPTYTQELNPISVAPYKSNTAVRLHIRVKNASGAAYAANSARIDNFRLKTYTNDYYPVSIPDTVLKTKMIATLLSLNIIPPGTSDLFSNHTNAAGFAEFAVTNPTNPPTGDLIQSLSGLEHSRGITSLEISRQSVSDLSPLVHMRSLQTLKVWSNPIEDFTVLPLLRNLRTAVLGDTDAEGAEWGPIAECTGLTELRVSDTLGFDNTALASVGPLTQLTTFYAHRTPITSLAGVGFNTKPLNTVAINETGVSDLADLVSNSNFTGATDRLEVLDCQLGAAAHCTQIPTLKAAPRSVTVLHESANCRTLTLTTLGAGTITASTPGPYLDGDTVTLTAQAGNGYVFHRWNVNEGESYLYELSPTLTVSGDATIRAEFLNGGYFTIQSAVNPAGNGSAVSVSPQAQIYTLDDVITLSAGPIASHAFTHWSGDENFLYGGEEFTLNSLGLPASFPNLVASIQQGGTPVLHLTANYVPALVYRPGCDLVLRVQVDKYVAGTVNAMGVSLDLGSWRFLGLVPGPNTPALYPQTGDSGMLEFIWLDNTVINTEAYLEFEIVVNVPWSAPEEFTIIGESECRTSEGMKRSSTYLYLTGDSENECATVPTQVLPLAIGNISNVTGSMAAGVAPACAGPKPGMHAGDYCPADFKFRHTEMLRMIELHGDTPGGALYHCDGSTDDGYAPGAGAANCAFHSLDFAHDAIPRDWRIDDVELNRAIELYQANGYIASQASLDGWAPNLGPEALVLQAGDSIAGHRISRIYPTTEIGDYLPRAYYGAKFEPIDQIWSGAGQGAYLNPSTETIGFIDDYIAALPGYPPAMSMLYFGSGVNSFQFDTNNLPAGVTDDMDLYVRKLETELLDDGSAFLPQIAVGFAGAMRNCALDEVQRVVVPEGVLFKYCLGSFCTDPVSSDGTAQEHEDVLERHRNFKWITDPIEVTKSPSSSPPTFEIRFKDLNANLLDVVSANPSEVGAVIPGASVTVLQEGRRERVNIDIPLSLSDSDLLSINLDPQEVEASIQNLVQALQNVGRPFFLRLGFEANGLHNQFCPEYFRSTYQKVITELRKKEHGLEFASVWHVTTGYGFDFEPFYPGDEFVDWMGVSIFFNGDIQPGGSKYNNLLDLLTFAESHLKPVIICESAPIDYGVDVDEFPRTCDASGNNCTPCPVGYDLDGESGRCVEKAEASGNDGLALPSDAAAGQRAWDAWFGPYFNLIRTHPGIKAFSYINVDFKPKKTPYVPWKKDCQLAKNEYVRQHFQQEMENPIFLHAKEQYPRKDSVRTYMTAFQSKLKYPEFVISTLNRPNVMRFTSTHEFILGAENAKVVTGVQDFSAFEEDTNSWRVYTLTPQGPVLIAALDDQTGNLLLGGALHSMGAEDTEPLDLDQVPLDWVLKEDIRSGSGSYNTVRFAGFTASGDLYVRERFLTSENKRLWDGTQNPGFMYYGFPDYADVIGPDTYCPLGTGPTLEERCNCILGSPWWNHGTGFICHTMNSSGNAIEKAMYEVTKVFEEFYSGLDVLSVDRFGNVDLPIGAVLQGGIVAASATEERVLVECGGIPKAKLLIYDNNGTISADLWLAGEVTVASKPFGELATCGVEFVDEDAHVVAVLDALGNLLTEGLVRARGQYLMDVNNWPLPIGPKEDL